VTPRRGRILRLGAFVVVVIAVVVEVVIPAMGFRSDGRPGVLVLSPLPPILFVATLIGLALIWRTSRARKSDRGFWRYRDR
jgi:hypothetical protein